MNKIKAIVIGALTAPLLALGGGLAYASTTTPTHPAPAPATVTTTAQHPTGQARLGWCDWRYTGHWCTRYGHSYQAQPAHQHRAYSHHSNRHQHRGGYSNNAGQRGYGGQSNWGYGYQGNGYQGGWGNSGSHWGNHSACCGHGW